MIATDVGGIPEIFGPFADRLIPCNDVKALSLAMIAELERSDAELASRAEEVGAFVQGRFSIAHMTDAVLAGYREAIAARTQSLGGRPKAAVTAA